MKCFTKALIVLQSKKYVTVYCDFKKQVVKQKGMSANCCFKSDFYISVYILIIFAVWVDFAFVAGFSAFSLKTRTVTSS